MRKSILTFGSILITAFSIFAQGELKIGEPQLTFDKEVHDYGTIEQNANGECEFTFTNTGSAPLLITKAIGTCGCTVPEWPREPIQPGATSSIIVRYDTKKLGAFEKGVTITTNTEPSLTKIKIKGEVKSTSNVPPLKPTTVPTQKK